MHIEFQNTKKDYIDLYNFTLKSRLKKNPAPITIILLILILSSGGKPFEWWNLITSLIIFVLIFVGLYFIAYLWIIFKLRRSTLTKESYSAKKILDTADEGLIIKYNSDDETKVLKWENIISAYSNEKVIYLSLSNKKTFIINKRELSDDVSIQFLDVVEAHLSKAESRFKNELTALKNKPPYWMGYLCLIPLVGAFVGIALIVNGIFKYNKNIKLIFMGVGGVIFTVTIYSSLYFFSISDTSRKGFAPFSQMQLNTLMKEVEFYKIQHGVYPDSLTQATKDDETILTNDPIQPIGSKHASYYYKKAGSKYYLFSSGMDGKPNTADDIYPKMAIADTAKFGLILK